MPERHGFVHGSKPEHKVGDKSRVLKSRKANPPVTNAQVAAGFEKFYGTTPPPERLPRKLITWKHQDFHGGPKGRRPLEPNVVGDRPSGKECPQPIKRASPRNRGRKWIAEPQSDVSMGPYFDRKKRVVDPKSGKRRIEMNSTSWEVHQLYGRLKQFGGKRSKAFHHGIFPSEKNYPPSHDKNGKWIDYSLVQYGGNLCDRGLRIEEQPAPTKDHLNNRATLPRGAAHRFYHQRKIEAINAGQTAMRQSVSRGHSRPHTSASRSGSQGRLASRGGTASQSSDWRDAKLAALRAELNNLRASTPGSRQ